MDTSGSDELTGGLPLFDSALRIEALREKIDDLASEIGQGNFRTRAEVADGVVMPLLAQLGWDATAPGMVVPGFDTGSGKVDYALCHPPGDPSILVKIGTLQDTDHGGEAHPFEDCSIRAIQLAISKDGSEWRFHFPAGRGRLRNREFARVDIVRDAEKAAKILDRYAGYHAVKSGEAFGQAERDYRERRFPAEALPAWRRSLLGREFLGLFLKEMERATGVLPEEERAEDFIRGQADAIPWPADPPDPVPARGVALGDKVWAYDFASGEIVTHIVVDRDPDFKQGEVSNGSAFGLALLGAREGEEREVRFSKERRKPVKVILIRRRGSG